MNRITALFAAVVFVVALAAAPRPAPPTNVEPAPATALPSIPHPDLSKTTPCPVVAIADGGTVTVLREGKC